MSDDRDRLRARRTPTAIREAIRSGSSAPVRPRLITSSDAVPSAVESEESTPVDMSQGDRIELRQRDHDASLIELARGMGDIRMEHAKTTVALEALVRLAEKSDERESRREEAATKAQERREERLATDVALRRSSREKVLLAVIAAAVTIATAYGIGSLANGKRSEPALPPGDVSNQRREPSIVRDPS